MPLPKWPTLGLCCPLLAATSHPTELHSSVLETPSGCTKDDSSCEWQNNITKLVWVLTLWNFMNSACLSSLVSIFFQELSLTLMKDGMWWAVLVCTAALALSKGTSQVKFWLFLTTPEYYHIFDHTRYNDLIHSTQRQSFHVSFPVSHPLRFTKMK